MVYWFERGGFLVLTGMPRPVLGESCTTPIKDKIFFTSKFPVGTYSSIYVKFLQTFNLISGVQIIFRRFLSKIGHLLCKNGTLCFIRNIVHHIVLLAFGTNLCAFSYTFGLPLRSLSSMLNSSFLNF